jgi:D-3-phosphoglycerate dehydrogenase
MGGGEGELFTRTLLIGVLNMTNKIVTAGDRVYLKFFDLDFFHQKAREAQARLCPFKDFDDERFKEEITDTDALILIDRAVQRKHIEIMRSCKIILALEVGYDFIDVEEATKKGIIVSNVPVYCTNQVAVHAFSLLLAVQRKLKVLSEHTAKGKWDYNVCKPLYEIDRGVLGIVGLGRIGRAVVPKAKGFDIDVLAYDPYLADDIFELVGARRCYELQELLAEADYVTLHVPLTEETYHMMGASEFSAMKSHGVIINTCRGKVIDERALLDALRSKKIAGAGLDVLETEPPEAHNPLLQMENVVVTPHVAWYSEDSMERLKTQGMDEVIRVLNGKRPWYVVNPEVLFMKKKG